MCEIIHVNFGRETYIRNGPPSRLLGKADILTHPRFALKARAIARWEKQVARLPAVVLVPGEF